MSAKLIKIRTIIDFILLNSNLSDEQFAKRLNKLISTHNKQVSQGMLAEDIVEQVSSTEQTVFLKNIKKRIYKQFEGTDTEDVLKVRYRDRGNYTYVANELHMSQGKYYYMMTRFYNSVTVELYNCGLIKNSYTDNYQLAFKMLLGRINEITVNESENEKIYSKFDVKIQENIIIQIKVYNKRDLTGIPYRNV